MLTFGFVPVYPFQPFPCDVPDRYPLPHDINTLGLEQAACALRARVITAVADACDREIDARPGRPFGVIDRWIPAAPVTVVITLSARDGARWQMVWFSASKTAPVVIDVDMLQPKILRAP